MSPEKRRQIVSELVQKNLSTAQIANRLGVPISTVRTDRLMLSVPNPEQVLKSAPEEPSPTPKVSHRIAYLDPSVRRHGVARKFRDGLSDKEIAHDLGISVMTVIRDRNRLGLYRESNRDTAKIRRAKVKSLLERGATNKEIQKELGISRVLLSRDKAAIGYSHEKKVEKRQEITDRRAKVKSLVEAGGSYYDVAAELGTSYMTVKRDCEAMGIASRRATPTQLARMKARRAEVRKAYESKKSVSEIVEMLGVSYMTVYRDMKALGLDQQGPDVTT